MKKYEIVESLISSFDHPDEIKGRKFYTIQALQNFGDVKAGDYGGYVESKDSLSHDGNCWIDYGSLVYGNSKIMGDARIKGEAIIGDSIVMGDTIIFGQSKIINSKIQGRFRSNENTQIINSTLTGSIMVFDFAQTTNTNINGNCMVTGNSQITDSNVIGNCVFADKSMTINSTINSASLNGNMYCVNSNINYGDQLFQLGPFNNCLYLTVNKSDFTISINIDKDLETMLGLVYNAKPLESGSWHIKDFKNIANKYGVDSLALSYIENMLVNYNS